MKMFNIYLIRFSERKKNKETEVEAIFKEVRAKNFFKLIEDMKPQIEGVQ